MKICIKCGEEKDLSHFTFRNDTQKYKNTCKCCIKNYNKHYQKDNLLKIKEIKAIYYENNRDIILERVKIYNINNPEVSSKSYNKYYKNNIAHICAKAKNYYNNNQEKVVYQKRKWRETNKKDLNKNRAIKRKEPFYKLSHMLSTKINKALKLIGSTKNNNATKNFLPYTIIQLKDHIEKQFEPWMTWNNHGSYNFDIWDDNNSSTWTWHIDHIIPQSKLLYTSMKDENFQKCWALSNLRPLSAKQNIIKGNR